MLAGSMTRATSVRAAPRAAFKAAAAPRAVAAPRARAYAVAVQASNLKVGDKMSDSSEYYRVLRRSDGGSVSLSSYQGKNAVVLFFYPKAGTPGCTKEVCKFRDEYKRFEDAGAVVFGISGDSPEENAAWAKANNLPFPLLSDQSNILRKTFGIKSDLLGLLPGRQTYVIDKSGKVILSFNDQLNAEQHVTEALNVLSRVTVNA